MTAEVAELASGVEPKRPYKSPYPGLGSYSESEWRNFHGRSEAIKALSRLVHTSPLGVVYGVSGIGKTSLIHAGLFHEFRESYAAVSIRLAFDDEHHSLVEQVCAKIDEQLAARGIEAPKATLPLRTYFASAELWSVRNELLTPLLVFDQFEEIFKVQRSKRSQVEDLLGEIAALTERGPMPAGPDGYVAPQPRILLSLREDFLAHLDARHALLPSVIRNRYHLTRMKGKDAIEAVTGPGKGIITEETARKIVRFVAAEADASLERSVEPLLEELEIDPVILSLICRELDLSRDEKGEELISPPDIDAEGSQIIEAFYDRVMGSVSDETRRLVEEELVDDDGFRTNRPLKRFESVPSRTSSDVQALLDARVLRSEMRFGTRHVELIHDRLARVAAQRRQVRRKKEAEEAAKAAADRIRKEEADAYKAREKKDRERRRLVLIVVPAVAAIIVLVAVFAAREWAKYVDDLRRKHAEERDRERAVDMAGKLADEGRKALLRGDSASAASLLVTARQALRDRGDALKASHALALRRALIEGSNIVTNVLHSSEIAAAKLDDDLRTVTVCGRDGTMQVSDGVSTWKWPTPWEVPLRATVISPDGEWALLLRDDGSGAIRTVGPGTRELQTIKSLPGTFNASKLRACVAPDGTTFASWIADQSGLRSWSLTRAPSAVTQDTFEGVDAIGPLRDVICLDGRQLLVLDAKGAVKLLAPGLTPQPIDIAAMNARVNAFSASRDGQVIAVPIENGGLRVLDRASARRMDIRDWGDDSSLRATVSPDGKHVLVTNGVAGRMFVGVWGVSKGKLEFAVERPTGKAAWSADGNALITWSSRRIEAWRREDWAHLGQIGEASLRSPLRTAPEARFDGKRLAIVTTDGATARVQTIEPPRDWMDRSGPPTAGPLKAWTITTVDEPAAPSRPTVESIDYPRAAFDVLGPDGMHAVVHANGNVEILDAQGTALGRMHAPANAPVRSVRWTEDKRLITVGARSVQVRRPDGRVDIEIETSANDAQLGAGPDGVLWTCRENGCDAWQPRTGGGLIARLQSDASYTALGGPLGAFTATRHIILPPVRGRPASVPAQPIQHVALVSYDGTGPSLITQDQRGKSHLYSEGRGLSRLGRGASDDAAAFKAAAPVISPGGTEAAVALDRKAVLIGGRDGAATELWDASATIVGMHWSSGGTRLAAADASLRMAIIDTTTQKVDREWTVRVDDLAGTLATFSPSGDRYAVLRADGAIDVRTLPAHVPIGRFDTKGRRIRTILLAGPGRGIAALADDALLTWPPPPPLDKAAEPVVTNGFFDEALLSNDGKRLIARSARGADVFRIDSNAQLLHVFHRPAVTVAIDDQGTRMGTWQNGARRIDFWRIGADDGEQINPFDGVKGSLVFQPGGGKYAWLREDRRLIQVLDPHQGPFKMPIKGAEECVFVGDGKFAACRLRHDSFFSPMIQLVEIPSGRVASAAYETTDDAAMVRVPGPSGQLAVAVNEGHATTLLVWDDKALNAQPRTLLVPPNTHLAMADDRWVWTLADSGFISRRDITAPLAEPAEMQGGTRLLDLAMIDESTVIAAIDRPGRRIQLVRYDGKGPPPPPIDLPISRGATFARFTPNRRHLVGVLDGNAEEIAAWTTGSKPEKLSLAINADPQFMDLAARDDGIVAIACQKELKLWLLEDADKPRSILTHAVAAQHLVFNDDGDWLATTNDEGVMQLWQVESSAQLLRKPLLTELARFQSDAMGARTMSFDRGAPSNWLASGNADGTTRLWSLGGVGPEPSEEESLIERAQRAAGTSH